MPFFQSLSSALAFLSEISRKKNKISVQVFYWQLLRDEILYCASTGEKGDKIQQYIFCTQWANLHKTTSQPACMVLFLMMSHMPIGVYLEAWV